jgi:hypothetical protein
MEINARKGIFVSSGLYNQPISSRPQAKCSSHPAKTANASGIAPSIQPPSFRHDETEKVYVRAVCWYRAA